MSKTISNEVKQEFVETRSEKNQQQVTDKRNGSKKELAGDEEMPEEMEFGCPHNVYDKITNIRSNCTH
uniref:Uncharacterized protein n=1 Tax=Panagrolaimus superbus TaxID=310955 RepID=A0A914YBW7_9BILA